MIDFNIRREYEQTFGCIIRYEEPGSNLVVDYEEKTYLIPSEWSEEQLQRCLADGLKNKKDVLFGVVKSNIVLYDPNVEY